MPLSLGGIGGGTTRPARVVPERTADYFIGGNGLPVLTSTPSLKMHHRPGASPSDGVRNSKLNKCLYNTAIRDGGVSADRPSPRAPFGGSSSNSSRSCKTESDITAIKPIGAAASGRFGKSPSSTRTTALSLVPGCAQGHAGLAPSRCSFGTVSSSGQSLQKSSFSPPPRLLTARSSMQTARTSSTTTTTSDRSSRTGQEQQQRQCRYSNLHKQLDNRLTYQRSYDRNIFGYDRRMDQFVLPPLPS